MLCTPEIEKKRKIYCKAMERCSIFILLGENYWNEGNPT